MVKDHFTHVSNWIFDLDNTLYPPSADLFAQIQVRMTDWVARELKVTPEEADRLRSLYWRDYGTTLSGMMALHKTDPDPYLTYVHDIDFSVLTHDAELRNAIVALPGRKIVFTNGSAPYAEKVLSARGMDGVFDAIYGIEHAGFHPKPQPHAYHTVLERDRMAPERAAMFEDDPRNLHVPHLLGMKTVHVAPTPLPQDEEHIHFHTDDLTAFLRSILR